MKRRQGLFLALTAFYLAGCGEAGVRHPSVPFGDRQVSDPLDDYIWRDHILLSDVPTFAWTGNDYQSAMLRDVMTHTNDRFTSDTPTTNAHETCHGLQNQMRNKTVAHDNFLYYGEGKGAYIVEPQLHLRNVASFVPQGARQLAQSRYNLYLIEQAASWSEVYYLYDEWAAYVVNAHTAVEMVQHHTYTGAGSDEVDGAMDFTYFGAAALLALKEREPTALTEQAKAVYAMLSEESMKYVNLGVAMTEFSGFHAKQLQMQFVTASENTKIRNLLIELYGPTWTKRVFGF